jgi:hypothetical protein
MALEGATTVPMLDLLALPRCIGRVKNAGRQIQVRLRAWQKSARRIVAREPETDERERGGGGSERENVEATTETDEDNMHLHLLLLSD